MFCGIGNPYIVASCMFGNWLNAFDADHHNDDNADAEDNGRLVS